MDLQRVSADDVTASVARHGRPVVVRDAAGAYWRCDEEGWQPMKGTGGDPPTGTVEAPARDVLLAPSDDPPVHPPKEAGAPLMEAFPAVIAAQKDAYDQGLRSSLTAQTAARDSILLDVDGTVWTVGLQTGGWYRYGKKHWHSDDPPAPERFLRMRAGRHACHACGAVQDDEAACASCGAEPAPLLEASPDHVQEGLVDFLSHCPDPQVPEPVTDAWAPPKH